MERNEISVHEVRVFRVLRSAEGKWLTSREVAEAAPVAGRTARAHLLRLVRLGVVDQAEVFPGHRYRLSEHASQRNRGYFDRIERADQIFGEAE